MSEIQPIIRPRAARPRDAAVLVLVDRSGDAVRILMGRRSAGHSFMPGKWVFPGGRLARQDYHAPVASELPGDVAGALAMEVGERRGRALAIAAIRETFEETGLRLAARVATARPRGAWRAFCGEGLAPDLGRLDLIARMITPPHRKQRFDTRFFLADAAHLADRRPVESAELDRIDWVPIDRTMALDLARPTRMVIEDLRDRLAGAQRPPLFRRFLTSRGDRLPIEGG